MTELNNFLLQLEEHNKKMKRMSAIFTTLGIVMIVLMAFVMSEPQFTKKPFSIHFNNWRYGFGYAAIIVGFFLVSTGQYEKGLKRGKQISKMASDSAAVLVAMDIIKQHDDSIRAHQSQNPDDNK